MISIDHRRIVLIICICVCIQSQDISIGWQSFIHFSDLGFEFSSRDMSALLLFEATADSVETCATKCHSTILCRTFDFDSQSSRCRIFQGDVATTGSIVLSSSSQSIVGSIELSDSQFVSHNQSCSFCPTSRYFRCLNYTCQCQANTYFDGSICRSQNVLGGACTDEIECRIDRNYTCLPRLQCGPLSLQNGTTVGGYENGTAGSDNDALNAPCGLSIATDGSLYVTEYGNGRVMRFFEGSTIGVQVAGSISQGDGNDQLQNPTELHVDAFFNIYVNDDFNYRVMFWANNSLTGVVAAGGGPSGDTAVGESVGRAVDSHGNIYVSEKWNHRVMKWTPNTTSGTLVIGQTGIAGNNSDQLNLPYGLCLDEFRGYLYIADMANHRIQRIMLNNSVNAITVAGGNGAGPDNNQLNNPVAVCLSKKTNTLYIAEQSNSRITRWNIGATTGVVLVGVTGQFGTSSILLAEPRNVALSLNETFLYVADADNNRVQRFELI